MNAKRLPIFLALKVIGLAVRLGNYLKLVIARN